MNRNLDQLEANLRSLFEEKIVKIFMGKEPKHTLIEALIEAMRDNLNISYEDGIQAPDHFTILVPEENYPEWQIHQDVLDDMAASLYDEGQSAGFIFYKPPTIDPVINPRIERNEFSISASFTIPRPILPDTAPMTSAELISTAPNVPEGAYFIIGGKTHFPLDKPVVNIGRHSASDLTLEDLHVSRHHAQLRVINQHYVIFDTGSTGGLFLNNKKISQATLHSGDVIRVGMVNLIYIQETAGTNPTTAIAIDDENPLHTRTQDELDPNKGGDN